MVIANPFLVISHFVSITHRLDFGGSHNHKGGAVIFSLDDALRALVPNDGDTWVRIAGWGKTVDVCTHPSPEVEGYMILLRCKGPMRYGTRANDL